MATIKELANTPAITGDVLDGLGRTRKFLPPKLFYDVRGSELFEQICGLPEYYLTRTERAILERNLGVIAAAAGDVCSVVELGAGSASKTMLLLQALARRNNPITYIPVDVSAGALQAAVTKLRQRLPHLHVTPVVADYTRNLPVRRELSPKLILYIGSSIGNFEPMEAAALLSQVRRAMSPADRLLLGIDLAKAPNILLPAYDDAQGVTAAFNKNVLVRINRELEGDFDLDRFRHKAVWHQPESRVEMHLESLVEQNVWLNGLRRGFYFQAGETIHTESSYKYTPAMLQRLFQTAGMSSLQSWTDDMHWFELHLLAADA